MSNSFIKMPEGIVKEDSTANSSYAKFIVQPLERGFGITLGNSLRRVLISSLPGAAITSVKFSGVLHEFTTIEGVVEDVAELILNLKQVRLKLLEKKPETIKFSFDGAGEFTAADIQKNSSEIEILNPELHIATLNKKAKFDVELTIGKGFGYIPAIQNTVSEQSVGVIPIDSIFTPVTNVKYEIENVRIGDRNDFEKLVLEVETDGSITPEDSLTEAAKILKDHIQLFINFDIDQEEEQTVSQKDSEKERIKKILLTNVDDLELSVRSHNCLKSADINILGDLVRKDESEMLKFRNFGRKSLAELTEIVENFGLEFGMDVDSYINNEVESK